MPHTLRSPQLLAGVPRVYPKSALRAPSRHFGAAEAGADRLTAILQPLPCLQAHVRGMDLVPCPKELRT